MRLLKAADHKRMAWKNGGGETIEIAVHPAGAGLSGFDWRVSMARVAGDGPFSVFPGVDRTLSILDGEGMDLDIEGHGRRHLTAASEPLFFPADAATTARLVSGPIADLNVMTRRGAFRSRVARIAVDADAVVPLAGRWNLLLTASPCRIEAAGFAAGLGPLDALLADGPFAAGVRAVGGPTILHAVAIADAT